MNHKTIILLPLVALYVPFLLIGLYANLFAECSCSHCHWFLLKMWPVLPALVPGTMVQSLDHHQILSRFMQMTLGGVITGGLLVAIVLTGLRSKRAFIAAVILEFLASCWMAIVAYAMVRA